MHGGVILLYICSLQTLNALKVALATGSVPLNCECLYLFFIIIIYYFIFLKDNSVCIFINIFGEYSDILKLCKNVHRDQECVDVKSVQSKCELI